LSKAFENLPAAEMYKAIRTKKIKLNKKRCEPGVKLCEGDVLELYIKDEFLTERGEANGFLSISPRLNILYEDENIILCDKKPGMTVHDCEGADLNNLINHICSYLYKKGEYDPMRENSFAPALCNRLDRNTGGIVICAKNAESLRLLNEKIKKGEIERTYLALVHGILGKKEDILTAYHKKNEKDNLAIIRKDSFAGAKIIKTKYIVLKEKDETSLVKVSLLTGRTHQIRAHFAFIGHPVVGDGKYGGGGERARADRKKGFYSQALYSYRLKFDFLGDSGKLDYLTGKSFEVKDVDFAKQF